MEKIRELRLLKKMTQEQLAEAMNVSAAAVSKWENGQSVPDILVLTALALRVIFTALPDRVT